ncbi:MAG: hypothetical protein M3R38_06885 [Actinomycetota bacterium]|nr:hypothetical protein [Actinomycetota bacterium]
MTTQRTDQDPFSEEAATLAGVLVGTTAQLQDQDLAAVLQALQSVGRLAIEEARPGVVGWAEASLSLVLHELERRRPGVIEDLEAAQAASADQELRRWIEGDG